MKKCYLLYFYLLSTFALVAQDFTGCVTIDFEEIPGETVTENLRIDDQYFDEFGITFTLENGQSPILARVGAPATAFGSNFGSDEPVPGAGIGEFFLTDDGQLSGLEMIPVIVNFAAPIDSFSACVLDIDFDEFFVIEARDEFGTTVLADTIFAGDPGTGDGISTCWGFNFSGCEGIIYSVRFEGFRDTPGAFGLGMDNFSFCFAGVDIANQTSVLVDDPDCNSGTGSITIINEGAEDYEYSLDGVSYQNSPIFAELAVGLYSVFVRDAAGCTAELDNIEVEDYEPLVFVTAESEATTCGQANGTVTLAVTPPEGVQFSLDGTNFQASGLFSNVPAGSYTTIALDADNCSYATQVDVAPSTGPSIVAVDSIVDFCNNGQGQLSVSATGGFGLLTYLLDGNASNNDGVFTNLATGDYLLEVVDQTGCTVSTTATVTGGPLLFIDNVTTQPPSCAALSGQIQFAASGGTGDFRYLLDSTRLQTNGLYSGLAPGTYDLLAIDSAGCSIAVSATVPLPVCPVYVPNVFSPNNDGSNDQFEVFTNSLYDVQVLNYRIYDRWGEFIYAATDFSMLTDRQAWWNGTFRGQPAQQGVYVYVIDIQYNDTTREQLVGDVTLIR